MKTTLEEPPISSKIMKMKVKLLNFGLTPKLNNCDTVVHAKRRHYNKLFFIAFGFFIIQPNGFSFNTCIAEENKR